MRRTEARRVDRALRVSVELLTRLGGRADAHRVEGLVAEDERRILRRRCHATQAEARSARMGGWRLRMGGLHSQS